MMEPGTKISIERRVKGMTQKDLARRAGITQANLSSIERGKRDLTVSTLIRIAGALDLKPSALLEEEPAKEIKFTRNRMEALAEAIINPHNTTEELEPLAEDFRPILPGSRFSTKQVHFAWARLRQKFNSEEIKAVFQRVEDAKLRQGTRA